MGAIDGDSGYANRKLDIEMRVNKPEMDNTTRSRASPPGQIIQGQNLPVAVDEDWAPLRADYRIHRQGL